MGVLCGTQVQTPGCTAHTLLWELQSLLLNILTCKDGIQCPENYSLRKAMVNTPATPYQVPSMDLLLSPLRDWELTLMSMCLYQAGRSVLCMSHEFHTLARTQVLQFSPLTQEQRGLRQGKQFAQVWIHSLCPAPTPGCQLPASGELTQPLQSCDHPDSVQAASCWRQWLHSVFVRNSTFETFGEDEKT